VEIPGKGAEVTVILKTGVEGALEGEVADQDRPALAPVILGNHMGVIVTFHEEDVVVDALTKADENHLLDHVRNRPRPGRAQGVVAPPEVLNNRTNDEGLRLLGGKLTDARDRDHPEEIHTGVGQTNVLREIGQLVYLDLCLRNEILPHQSADVTLHQGVVL
jgi:hypothetical protein